MADIEVSRLFKSFLSYFWLRPENALICTMRAKSTQNFPLTNANRGLDISCGDGVYSFISHGGELSFENDMYQSVRIDLKRSPTEDHFDHFKEEDYQVNVVREPEVFFHTGTDWKHSMLKRSKCLGVYVNLVQHDNNQVMPFEDESYDYVYSNSIYWVDQIQAHFQDMVRVCQKDGLILLHVKTPKMFDLHVASYADKLGPTFASIINSGRHESYKGLLTLDEYVSLGKGDSGVVLEDVVPVYDDLVGKIWDIGLRPIFKPLFKMYQHVPEESRGEIKQEWVDIFYTMLEEYVMSMEPRKENCMEYLLVFRRR